MLLFPFVQGASGLHVNFNLHNSPEVIEMSNLKQLVGAFLLLAIACVGLANAADQEATLTGKWDVVVELPIGPGNPSFDISQNGKQLTGTYKGALGESPVTGSIEGNSFKIVFNVANIECEYTGTLVADEISGKVTLKGLGDGTFKGTRAR
jgi:hypothetical protein